MQARDACTAGADIGCVTHIALAHSGRLAALKGHGLQQLSQHESL